MAGLDPIAVKISMIVLRLLVFMEPPALMALVPFIAAALQGRQAYCVIWMMLALQILVTPMPSVTQVPLTVLILALVQMVSRVLIVQRILMNVIKVLHVNTTVFVSTLLDLFAVIALKGLRGQDARQT